MSPINENAVLQACMADLSRERQEELPLSDVSRRGPTFMPGRGTGVDHIPKELKAKLSRGWSGRIEDEESKQMQGLEYEDARPWARQMARDYMRTHVFQTAPPELAPIPNRRNNANEPTSTQRPRAPQKSIDNSSARQRQSNVLDRVQKTTFAAQQPQQQPTKSFDIDKAQALATKNAPRTTSPIGTSQTKLETTPSSTPVAQDQTLFKGPCEIVTGVNGKNTFAAEFSLRANLKTSRGFLVLAAPGKGPERVHDVLNLDPPVVQGVICMVTCQQGKGAFKYSLRFKSNSDTDRFRHFLKSLQDSAAKHLKASIVAANAPSSIAKETETTKKAEEIILPSAQTVYSKPVEETPTESTANNILIPVSNDSSQMLNNGGDSFSLIRIDDSLSGNGFGRTPVPGVSIYDAAHSITNIVHNILVQIAGKGYRISESAVKDVENAVVQNWSEVGFMKGEDEAVMDDFRDLLRTLIRIKLRADGVKEELLTAQIPAIRALKQDPIPEIQQQRITYTAEELRRLEWKPMPRREENEDSDTSQENKPRSVIQPTDAKKAAITAMSKHKAWLAAKPSSHKQASDSPTPESRQDGSSLHVNEAGSPTRLSVVHLSPTPEPKPRLRGLASSRWASPSNYTVSATESTEVLESKQTPRVVEVLKVAEAPKPDPTSRPAPQGLSASRWAKKPVAFDSRFTRV